MAIQGQSRVNHQRWNFTVEIDDITVGGFRTCGELKKTVGTVTQAEGGRMVDTFEPAKVKFEPVTLEIGATENRELYDWSTRIANGVTGTGDVPTDKKDLAIVERRRDGTEIRRWNIYNAFPTDFIAGSWDASAEEITVQSITLVYEYFELVEA